MVKSLAKLPENTVVDGEIVAFDEQGRPSFGVLQNYGSAPAAVAYYVFDLMVVSGKDVTREPLETRRKLLAHVEFLEWTDENHLRHSRFVGLREDKKATDVRRG